VCDPAKSADTQTCDRRAGLYFEQYAITHTVLRTVSEPGTCAREATMAKKTRKASADILLRLSANLKRLREARGYTQEQLANVCGVTKSYVSNVEQATVNITLANLETLAKGLGCTESDLLRRPTESQGPLGGTIPSGSRRSTRSA
jgi:DNA-binding Xre family transcriptional regulator